MTEFSVLVLGSGAATPTFARNCSGQLLNINGMKMLLDCGESTQNHLRKYHQKLQSIKWVFLSHLHGDHFFGLPGLISTMHLCGRQESLTLFAPKGVKEALELFFNVSGTTINFPFDIVELDNEEPKIILQEKTFHVTAFPLHHSIPTFGYRFDEETPLLNLLPGVRAKYNMTNDVCVAVKQGEDMVLDSGEVVPNSQLTQRRRKKRSYAYCCDTAYDESLIPIVEKVDLLCMESTFDNTFVEMAQQRCHCTAEQAATIANRAEVGKLLLTHFSARYKTLDTILEQAKAVFPNTECASDGCCYQLGETKTEN